MMFGRLKYNEGMSFKEAAGNMPWSEDGICLLSRVEESILIQRLTGNSSDLLKRSAYHISETSDQISITIQAK